MEKRRCKQCQKLFPLCDLAQHPQYGLICKNCYDNLHRNK